MTIKDLQPKAVWENFYGLTRVPRPSKHEGKVQDYLLGWGKEHGVDVKRTTPATSYSQFRPLQATRTARE